MPPRDVRPRYARDLGVSSIPLRVQSRHDPDETLRADALYSAFNPGLIAEILRMMTPERAVVVVSVSESSAKGGDDDDRSDSEGHSDGGSDGGAGAGGADGTAMDTEPAEWTHAEAWFGTRYRRETPSDDRVATWRAAYDRGGTTRTYRLPQPNDFIPTDYSLRHSANIGGNRRAAPDLIRVLEVGGEERGALFHRPDTRWPQQRR